MSGFGGGREAEAIAVSQPVLGSPTGECTGHLTVWTLGQGELAGLKLRKWRQGREV